MRAVNLISDASPPCIFHTKSTTFVCCLNACRTTVKILIPLGHCHAPPNAFGDAAPSDILIIYKRINVFVSIYVADYPPVSNFYEFQLAKTDLVLL